MYYHGMSTASQASICFLPPGERGASPWPRPRWMTQGPINHNPPPIPDIHHGQHHTQRQRSQRQRDGHRHLHLRCRLCPFAREDHRHWRHAFHPPPLPPRSRLCPFAREDHRHWRHAVHPRRLPPGQSRVWQATFTPTTAATQRADCTITVNNDAGGVLAQSAAFTVDNVRPYIVNFDMPSVIPGSGARTTIYVTFTEPVSDDTAGATIFSSAEGGYSRGTPDNGGRTWIYQYWPKAANGTNYINMYLSTFKDLAGNAGSDDSAQYYVKSMTVDSLKPTVASASIAKSDLRLGEKTTITITFSELVTRSSFTIEDLQVDAGKGTLSNLRVAPSDTTATTTAATTWLVDLEAPATRPPTAPHANPITNNPPPKTPPPPPPPPWLAPGAPPPPGPATPLKGNKIRITLDHIPDAPGNAGASRGV